MGFDTSIGTASELFLGAPRLPDQVWAEAVKAAICTKNRAPMEVLSRKALLESGRTHLFYLFIRETRGRTRMRGKRLPVFLHVGTRIVPTFLKKLSCVPTLERYETGDKQIVKGAEVLSLKRKCAESRCQAVYIIAQITQKNLLRLHV